MGLFDRFSSKNRAAEQEKIIAGQKEREHRSVVEEQRKAHENLIWPGVPRLNALKNREGVPAAEDPLTEARKDEIGPLVYEPSLTPEMIAELSVQELLFLQLTMELYNSKEPLVNYEKNHRVLHNEFLGRVHQAEKFYILFDRRTGYPLIDGGYVLIYFGRERADQAAELYKRLFRDAAVVERPGEAAPEGEDGRKPMALFDWLYYLGAENVMVDNGWYKGALRRSEVSAPLDWNSDPKTTPPSNPGLAFAMTDYVSEMRWPVKYDKREENLRKKSERMMKRIPSGRYLVPTRVAEVDGGQAPAGPDGKSLTRQVQLPSIRVNKQNYLPVFTDILEYSKKFARTEMKPAAFEYKNLLKFVGKGMDGIIINPNGQGIVIPKDKAESLLFLGAGGGEKGAGHKTSS